jgi:hypothetical protein
MTSCDPFPNSVSPAQNPDGSIVTKATFRTTALSVPKYLFAVGTYSQFCFIGSHCIISGSTPALSLYLSVVSVLGTAHSPAGWRSPDQQSFGNRQPAWQTRYQLHQSFYSINFHILVSNLLFVVGLFRVSMAAF